MNDCIDTILQKMDLFHMDNELPPHKNLRPTQIKALEAFYNKKDSLVMMPTGGGKSLIFQVTPYIRHFQKHGFISSLNEVQYTTLVISPLNALMKDQVKSLCEKGIPSTYLNMTGRKGQTFILKSDICEESDNENECYDDDELLEIEIDISRVHEYALIYSHPEALLSTTLGHNLLKKICSKTCCIAIDEAHMVCEWGTDFRKDFGRLKDILVKCPQANCMTLTATANEGMRKELIENLELNDPIIVIANPDRPNIFYNVKKRPPSTEQYDHLDEILGEIAQELKEKGAEFPLTIFYTDYNTISYAMTFMEWSFGKCDADEMVYHQYHSVTTEIIKRYIVEQLRKENPHIRLVFATIALGMGLNAPHVRKIIHYKPPKNLDRYLQETGRAGRDGEPAEAIMYWNNTDIRKTSPGMTTNMKDLCKAEGCIRKILLAHLGFDIDLERNANKCCFNCARNGTIDNMDNENVNSSP